MDSIMSPEEFLKTKYFALYSEREVREKFSEELSWMNQYGEYISTLRKEDLQKVIVRVNFLMRACLRLDEDQINQFLIDNGVFDIYGEFGIDYNKIINDGPKGIDK